MAEPGAITVGGRRPVASGWISAGRHAARARLAELDLRMIGVVSAITIGGGVLRFATLSQGIWYDEALTLRDVSGGLAHLMSSVAHQESHPPLYFLLLWIWRHLVGSSTFVMRTFSAGLGTITIPIAFLAARRFAGRRVALVVTLLTATSPALLYYSEELRPYALAVLLCMLAFLQFARALQEPSTRKIAVWAILSALALQTHYTAALGFIPQAGVLLARLPALRRATAIASGGVCLVCLPLLPLLNYQDAHVYGSILSQIGSPYFHETINAKTVASGNGVFLGHQLFVGPGGPYKTETTVWILVLVLVALAGLWRHPRDAERSGGELALMLFLPGVAAAALFQVLVLPFQGRYLLPLWLPLTIAVAVGLVSGLPRRLAFGATALLCATGLANGIITATVPRYSGREDTRGPALAVGEAATTRLIGIDQQWDVLPLKLYRPQARSYERTVARVDELDLIGMPLRSFPADTDAARPPLPRISGLPAGLQLRQVIRGPTYYIERYTSRTPVSIPLAPQDGVFPTSWRFLLEPAGARAAHL